MKKITVSKDDFLDVVKSVVFSIAITLVLVLLFAIIVKFTEISDSVITPVNIVIKTISIFVGTLLGMKSKTHGAIKGAITGALFMLITYLVFSLINGSFTANPLTLLDAVILIIEGIISGIIVVNIKGKKAKY